MVLDWGMLKWMATPDLNDSTEFSAGIVLIESGKGHDLHTHPDSDEILYFVSGEGEQSIDGETREISAGEMIFVPAGVEHGTWNTSWEPLKALIIYAPPGPEDVLADQPDCTIVPPGEMPAVEN